MWGWGWGVVCGCACCGLPRARRFAAPRRGGAPLSLSLSLCPYRRAARARAPPATATADGTHANSDLKCDNLLVNGASGEVKIADLGLASCKRSLSVVGACACSGVVVRRAGVAAARAMTDRGWKRTNEKGARTRTRKAKKNGR